MFTAQVYRIMIGCPGDIQEEVRIAIDVINHWTTIHAEQRRIVLLPVNWSSNSYPEHGAHPQKILNEQLSSRSDMLIAIFGSKLGTPTDTSMSGTIEEIEEHIKEGKPVMLFFRKFNDTTSITADDISRLESFKLSIKNKCLFKEYISQNEFEKTFSDAIELFLSDHWLEATMIAETHKNDTVLFSDAEIDVLRKWVDSDNNTASTTSVKDGKYFFLGNKTYMVQRGREEAYWNGFLERLQKEGFISYVRTNKQGSPVYELQMKAYEYFNKD